MCYVERNYRGHHLHLHVAYVCALTASVQVVCTCLGTDCLFCQGSKEGALVSPRDLPLRFTNKQTPGYLAGRHGPSVSGAQARQRANEAASFSLQHKVSILDYLTKGSKSRGTTSKAHLQGCISQEAAQLLSR